MDIQMADVTIHIDQALEGETLKTIEQAFRQRMGVLSFGFNPERPHLVVVEYNPKMVKSRDLIDIPRFHGLRGELVGL